MPRYPKKKNQSEASSAPSGAQQRSTFGQLSSGEPSFLAPTPSFGQLSPSSSADLATSFSQNLSITGDNENQIKFAPKKYGTLGKQVKLKSNFFQIKLAPTSPNYFHYNIEIIKDEDANSGKKGNQPKKDTTPKSKKTPKRLNDTIFKTIFEKYKNIFNCGGVLPVFDGEKNFYSMTKFTLPNNQWTGKITVKDKDKDMDVRVNITIPEISHGQNLKNLMQKTDLIMPVELQALDIIMRNGPRLTKVALGPNLFHKYRDPRSENTIFDIGIPRGRDNMDKDVIIYGQFGHYQSVRKCEGGLFFNVDRAMAIFSYGGSLIEAVKDIITSNNIRLSPRDKNLVEEKLKGLKFSCLHLNYHRTFIIAGLSKDTCKNTMFKDSNGQQVSVFNYFQKEYAQFCKKNPIDGNLPCIQVGSRNNAKNFPMEVCVLEEDEVYRRKLSPKLQGMVTRKSSQQTPFDRFTNIEGHMKSIEADSTIGNVNYMNKFGITVPVKKATEITARVLDAPEITYKKSGKDDNLNTQNSGSWDMKNLQFYVPATGIERNWMVVNIHSIQGREHRSSIQRRKIDIFVKELIRESKNKGINLSDPQIESNFNYRGKGTLEHDLFNKVDKNCKLLIVIIPTKDEIYHEIKTIAELKKGVITQCLNQDNKYWREDKFSGQLLSNILFKINPKCGGTNNILSMKDKPPILRSKLMIIGLDVTHPSPTDGLNKSIASVVGSYTNKFDKYFHQLVVQEKARKEVVDLRNITKFLLANFKRINNFYPTKILVYRDGIGEGDFAKVINIELASIANACKDLEEKQITITYIMVQKRHNTRFIPTNIKSTDKPNRQNVQPGTVVDKHITHHKFFEFYMCSHAGMMGTSRPAKYVVLHDENNLDADEIQYTTYFLCYLYPRCTKSSSLPPPVLYAHLLCKRGRSYLASEEDNKSSVSSGNRELSKSEINNLNEFIQVKDNIQGQLFFV